MIKVLIHGTLVRVKGANACEALRTVLTDRMSAPHGVVDVVGDCFTFFEVRVTVCLPPWALPRTGTGLDAAGHSGPERR